MVSRQPVNEQHEKVDTAEQRHWSEMVWLEGRHEGSEGHSAEIPRTVDSIESCRWNITIETLYATLKAAKPSSSDILNGISGNMLNLPLDHPCTSEPTQVIASYDKNR